MRACSAQLSDWQCGKACVRKKDLARLAFRGDTPMYRRYLPLAIRSLTRAFIPLVSLEMHGHPDSWALGCPTKRAGRRHEAGELGTEGGGSDGGGVPAGTEGVLPFHR